MRCVHQCRHFRTSKNSHPSASDGLRLAIFIKIAVALILTSRSWAADSQLANFWDQLPNAAAWAHSPLEVTIPADYADNLVRFKRGLAAESGRSLPGLKKAYVRAGILVDQLSSTYSLRSQTLARGAGNQSGAAAQWLVLVKSQKSTFKGMRLIFDEAVRTGGGLSQAIPVIADTLPLATISPAPAGTASPDFEATLAWIRVAGAGPSGTNFGWGDRRLKLGVMVTSDSDVPLPVRIKCYWIAYDGRSYSSALGDNREGKVSGTEPLKFETVNVVQRTNGMTNGVLTEAYKGVYRGWVITVDDPSGKRVALSASRDELKQYVP